MIVKLEEKLQMLRKQNGLSQEQLAERLGIARQTVSKWETGQAVPELSGLIMLSELYSVSIDRLVKEGECGTLLSTETECKTQQIIEFLMRAKRSTYAGGAAAALSSRTESHDFAYEDGEYAYYDTYLGSERFGGEEAVWYRGVPVWCMNYIGRVTGENFSGEFLKEALYNVPATNPFRGPELYSKGDYHYHCSVIGDFDWYQGCEEIFYLGEKVYECHFHGGSIK